MNRQTIQRAYDCMTPSPAAKVRMLNNILAQADKQKRTRPRLGGSIKRIALVAAVNALVIALSVAAYTAGWLGGRQSSLPLREPEQVPASPSTPALVSTEPPTTKTMEADLGLEQVSMGIQEYDVGFGQTATGEFISLQGVKGSPEYEAAMEWRKFSASYDPDGTLRAAHSGSNLDEAYKDYGCYTQKMADKIDDICEKYDLAMLVDFSTHKTTDEFFEAAKTGAFFSPLEQNYVNTATGGYTYADGSFHLEGELCFIGEDTPWPYPITYQITRSVKGSFSSACLKIDNADYFDVWEYTTQDGITLMLALSPERGLILADLQQSFVVVNQVNFAYMGDVITGEKHMSRETWEAFADAFDFSAIP